VTSDGADWITNVVAARAPQAVLCADPFHVVSWATGALDEVRREAWRQARAAGQTAPRPHGSRVIRLSAGGAADLKRARYTLWKNPGNLTGPQQAKLAWIEKTHPYLYRAYLLKEGLRATIPAQRHRRQKRPGSLAIAGSALPHPRIHRTRPENPPPPGMVRWTLVLPLDLSPAEERWFSGQLASQTEVPISWIGRTQLEAELSRHRDLLRAFAPGSTERRAMDLLASYHAERAGLAQGMADGIPRLVSLKEQLDVIDPDWAFDVQIAESNVDVRLRPKDADAPRRRPIGVAFAIDSANDTAVAEAVEKFLKYGRPVAIPGENILAYAVDLPGNLNQVVAEGSLAILGR